MPKPYSARSGETPHYPESLADFENPADVDAIRKERRYMLDNLLRAAREIPSRSRSKLSKGTIPLGDVMCPTEEEEQHNFLFHAQKLLLKELKEEIRVIERFQVKSDLRPLLPTGPGEDPEPYYYWATIYFYPEKVLKLYGPPKEADSKVSKNSPVKELIFYNENGDVFRNPKGEFSFLLSPKKLPWKIIHYLITQPDSRYVATNKISAAFDDIKTSVVRTTIGKANRSITSLLSLREKFIESKKDSGYRINPVFTVSLERNTLGN